MAEMRTTREQVKLDHCDCGGGAPILTTIAIVLDSPLLCHYYQCTECGQLGDSSPTQREAALYWNHRKPPAVESTVWEKEDK